MPPPVRLICSPSTDRAFARDAAAAAARIPDDLELGEARAWFEAALRATYPTAVVREQDELARTDELVVIWYVTKRNLRTRIDTSLVVPVSLQDAYRIYVDRVVEWQTAVQLTPIVVTLDAAGSEYEACYSFLGRTIRGRFRVLAADPPNSVACEAEGSGLSVWYTTRFAPDKGGTRVHVQGDYDLPDGLVPRIADRLGLERAIGHDIDRANASYRDLCIRLTAPAAGDAA
jgi:hypothetical protein